MIPVLISSVTLGVVDNNSVGGEHPDCARSGTGLSPMEKVELIFTSSLVECYNILDCPSFTVNRGPLSVAELESAKSRSSHMQSMK